MPPIQYDAIARDNYFHIGNRELTNGRLQDYFNGCFQQAIDSVACYPAWACVACIGGGTTTAEFGNMPRYCPVCKSRQVFEIATFQGRASIVGKVFESAVRYLLTTGFELPAVSTPGNTNTHDIEVTPRLRLRPRVRPATCKTPTPPLPRFTAPDWNARIPGKRPKPTP